MGIAFGNFYGVCNEVSLVVCPLLGSDLGLEPSCYSRNVEINSTIIFQPGELRVVVRVNRGMNTTRLKRIALAATCFIHIAALIMTAIMIYHIRSKYTAVGEFIPLKFLPLRIYFPQTSCNLSGRKEIVLFFYLYGITEILVIFLESAIIPTYSPVYSVSAQQKR